MHPGLVVSGRRSLWVALVLVLTGGRLSAQDTQNVPFLNGYVAPLGVLASNAYVGPYAEQVLSLPGQPLIDGFSADYLDDITSVTKWTGYVVSAGTADLSLKPRAGEGFSSVEKTYLEAAGVA